jgi:hypothetical protein
MDSVVAKEPCCVKHFVSLVRRGRHAGLFAGSAVAGAILFGGAAFARVTTRPAMPNRPTVVAQFGLGNLLGAGKDLAVKTALSTFGKSLGGQLPIVVDANDAYPTVATLPGPPFAPAAVSANIAGPLRSSQDGTIALPPGDYVFPVSVFCMRARSGSPDAHRYLVAPLHGSAADIVTALNSRIPSYALDHHVLQVLSWDIQAGMAYSAMPAAQRAAVDKIIPDYRGRLNGDVYERIHDQYTNIAQNIPAMPSFEEALTRVGPAGAQVVAMQSLRVQLAQPPPTFEDLARLLVPFVPAQARSVSDRSGETPWSRYSDRVFVRFVTAGNYATPGTYAVRVLPPPGSTVSNVSADASRVPAHTLAGRSMPRSGTQTTLNLAAAYPKEISAPSRVAVGTSAGVPFTNVVNNPGTDAVQPLTQTPQGGGLPPPPSLPSHCPNAITSATLAPLPADHVRKIVGVGEQVRLTYTDCSASWTIATTKDGIVGPTSGTTVVYTAASEPTQETIIAHGPRDDARITFDVIAPTGLIDRQAPCTEGFHRKYYPDTGMLLISYVTPDNVSFTYIDQRELDIKSDTATGIFGYLAGHGHQNGDNEDANGLQKPGSGSPVSAKVVPGLGSLVNSTDLAYVGSNVYVPHPPYAPGLAVWKIPMEYKVKQPNPGTAAVWHPFANNYVAVQTHMLAADGLTLTTTKAWASIKQKVGDPTTEEPTDDVVARQGVLLHSCPTRL